MRAKFPPGWAASGTKTIRRPWGSAAAATLGIVVLAAPVEGQTLAAADELGKLSIEQLGELEVTSASKRPEPLKDVAASLFVITEDDIRRSGATNLPEVLRLAPNLEVARLNAFSYTVTARGFNSPESADKLLVLVDGRSVYSPLGSTVFWESVNVPLDTIERIEVVAGPGGTLWGTNAVNGVINIITYASDNDRGFQVHLGGGSMDRTAFAQYSGALDPITSYRIYASGFDRSDTLAVSPSDTSRDAWRGFQSGFRTDSVWLNDTVTVQGALYNAKTVYDFMQKAFGGNAKLGWTHAEVDGASDSVALYYQVDNRAQPGLRDLLTTYDVQAQRNQQAGIHQLVFGSEFRLWHEGVFSSGPFGFAKPNQSIEVGSFFGQDQIPVTPALGVTLGLRLEDNSLSGFDYLPDARIAWKASANELFWAAISRSVRTPSRIEKQLEAPPLLAPSPHFQSETLIAYEAGYRGTPLSNLSLSFSAYFNHYDRIRTDELTNGGLPIVLGNGITGHTYGFDASATYAPLDWWRLIAGYQWLSRSFRLKPGHSDFSQLQAVGQDPGWQWQLRSEMELPWSTEFDVAFRGVDHVTRMILSGPVALVPGYVEADVRLGWSLSDDVELSLEGQNLLHDNHLEVVDPSTFPVRAIPRSVFVSLRSRI